MRNLASAIALALVAVGCGSASEPATTVTSGAPVVTTTGAPTSAPTTLGAAPLTTVATTTTSEPSDFTVFLAAVDEALAGTSFEGLVLGDADVFVAIGQLMCERLDGGATAEATLGEFLDALQIEGAVATDDAEATGVVFGAAIESICPQHSDALG